MAGQRYTRKDEGLIRRFVLILCLVLSFLIFDNWLGMTLAQNNALPSYTGKCTEYVDMYIPRGSRSSGYNVFYDFTLDNGMVLSTPEDGLWDAGLQEYELDGLIGQELTVTYYPGILPIPPARLVRAYMGDREIVTEEPTLAYFSQQISLYSLALILPGIAGVLLLLGAFQESPYWQRHWPKLRKAIKQWRYRSKR